MTGKKTDTPEKFLRKRGFSADGAIYMRMLMEIIQKLRILYPNIRDPEIREAMGDMLEYVEHEKEFVRNCDEGGK